MGFGGWMSGKPEEYMEGATKRPALGGGTGASGMSWVCLGLLLSSCVLFLFSFLFFFIGTDAGAGAGALGFGLGGVWSGILSQRERAQHNTAGRMALFFFFLFSFSFSFSCLFSLRIFQRHYTDYLAYTTLHDILYTLLHS
ncbi:hypothetical protein B0T22DRAFT_65257 [Podospora appendiculata]|uniref:Uncharacterized protein n=1 Tax=Podospora appendiculata TaxID=314037 RepID=A0AAE1CHA5_9PEZI|nr:hypothetical protein B0T22DRAFT_65257 [Podospora appendiculata]